MVLKLSSIHYEKENPKLSEEAREKKDESEIRQKLKNT